MASRLDTTGNKSAIREISVQHSKLCLLLFKLNIMELSEEFKNFVKSKYFCSSHRIKNPSAFTSIYFHRGGTGRFYYIRSLIKDEIKKITQEK